MASKRKLKKPSKKIKHYNKNTNKNTINIKIGLNTTKRKSNTKPVIKKVEGVSTIQPYYVNPQNIIKPSSNYQNQAYFDNVKVKNDAFKNPEPEITTTEAFKDPEKQTTSTKEFTNSEPQTTKIFNDDQILY